MPAPCSSSEIWGRAGNRERTMVEKELSQTGSAYAQLESMIIFEQLESGAMYSEKQLADMLDMGRTPIREALQKLAWEQMVNIYPRRGIQIPNLTVEKQLKLLEVRRPIEALCAGLAAEKATREQKKPDAGAGRGNCGVCSRPE